MDLLQEYETDAFAFVKKSFFFLKEFSLVITILKKRNYYGIAFILYNVPDN